ncbi:MAG: hypothetical protein E7478_08950 [Ruminococcaceae bacterium]|nr:hypothetical protein [Oscillospiraceae bacterium]
MSRIKVFGAYSAYAVLFAIVFVVMLSALTAAVICIPFGLFLGLVGGVILLFDTSFILTELAPEIMLFGGLFSACFSAFLGFASVKIGLLAALLFDKVRRYCDRVRGW